MPNKNPEQDDFEGLENQGEGNKTAAREYNRDATEHARSGKSEPAAKDAQAAVEADESGELQRAEDEGRRHIAEEDPELRDKG
jgi:hypothetical protein